MTRYALGDEGFAYVIVIFAAALHLILITVIIVCACCKKQCNCLDITNENVRRNNNDVQQQIERLPDQTESDVEQNIPNENLVESRLNRTVTGWRTSFLTRVQARLGFPGPTDQPIDPPIDQPPAYGSHDFDECYDNPVNSEDDYLPGYEDHRRHLPSWYGAMETGSEEDKPPLYEDVVNQKNS